MSYLSDYQYYENSGATPEETNWGSYQYTSLYDIVNNFMLMYQGNHSLVNNEERFKVLFHAKRAIQELNYDAFKEVKALELAVDDSLRYVMPSDYVNWVRISMYKGGVLYPLSENIQTQSAKSYVQNSTGKIILDVDGNVQLETSSINSERIAGSKKSIYLDGRIGYNIDDDWYFTHDFGPAFGLNTETANINPTFTIDKKAGVINFSSSVSNNNIVLEYISDGMEAGDDSKVSVNKFFEEYLYAYIEYAVLNSKLNVQEYVVRRAQKRKTALLRNAKIRISNITPGRLLMNMRGQDKWLK